MKLLFLSTETRPVVGGVAHALDGWMTGLADIGHEVRMVALLPEETVARCSSLPKRPYSERWVSLPEREENMADRFLPFRKLRSAVFLHRRRRAVLDAFEEEVSTFVPDCVVFSVMNEVCCLPLHRAKQMKLRCAGIVYGAEIHPKRVAKPAWLRNTLGMMDRVIAISEYTRELSEEWGVPEERLATVHPSLTNDVLEGLPSDGLPVEKRKHDFAAHKLKLLTVCRLIERKGVQVVLDAVALLDGHQQRIEYHVVGDGPYRAQLEMQANALGLNGVVRFHGNVPEEAKQDFLAQCDVFVMTPFETHEGDVEGFGIVYLEAGAVGKPVIASHTGGVPDAVLGGRTGILVQQHDVNALRQAIITLLDDRRLRFELGTNGRQWAAIHMPSAVARNLEDVLLRAASPPRIGRDSDPTTAGQPFMRDTSNQPKETHYHRVQRP
jgi:glycosyltransferase involved in cell wall biosynthesis